MQLLEDMIVRSGHFIGEDIVQVDMFLNHQIDVALLDAAGKEFYEHFKEKNITKILTIEASGIAVAVLAARYFGAPVVFAKKNAGRNSSEDRYTAQVYSFTKNVTNQISVSKEYLSREDRVLVIDDFLADGNAVTGLMQLIQQAGATLCGVGIVVEKSFQKGGKLLREQGVDLLSLARIAAIKDGVITFDHEPSR